MADEDPARKGHRKRQAGPKAEKKKAKNKHEQELDARQRNPKAFSYHSANKVAKAVRRTLDIKEKKHHIPLVDRTPVEPPPVLVAVVGPPKVGKSTLIQCLIKNYTKKKLSSINGPVTIVSGKKRRLTIMECNNDINSMIDIAKIADLVLLLVDASFGFEMEIFEFLNICQVHGFPKIMGVLTHLDHFRQAKQLQKTKKRLKQRFWTEVYQGAKLFYLSGLTNGEYLRTEVHNLGRFISVMKFRPMQWRSTHPYILGDRMEDVTDPESVRLNAKADRNVCLYGYVRGTHFKNKSHIHIPGCGDFNVHDVSYLQDPCPLPNREKKTRSLDERERNVYAPMSGVGGIVYDKDAVYIDLGGSHSMKKQTEEEESKPKNLFVSSIIDSQKTLDEKIEESEVRLFHGADPIKDVATSNMKMPTEQSVVDAHGRTRRKAVFDNEEDDDDDDDDEESDDDSEDDEADEGMEEDDSDNEKLSENEQSETESQTLRPLTKKSKTDLENVQYADSDDDLESDSGHPVHTPSLKVKSKPKKDKVNKDTVQITKKKDKDSDNSDSEPSDNDSNSDGESDTNEPCGSNSNQELSVHDKIKAKLKEMEARERHKQLERSEERSDESEGSESENDDNAESGFNDEEMSDDSDTNQDSENSDGEVGKLKWKDNLAKKAQDAFLRRQKETPNLRKMVYGDNVEKEDENENGERVGGGLFKIQRKADMAKESRTSVNGLDCSKFPVEHVQDWELEEVMEQIKDCFVTGNWDTSEDAQALLDQDDELFGDFEDLETGEKFDAKDEADDDDIEEKMSNASDDEADRGKSTKSSDERKRKAYEKRLAKKENMKKMFDAEYDNAEGGKGTFYDEWKSEMEQQAQMNRKEFEDMDEETRAQYEGFRPGVYVRVQINGMPCEFVDNFDPSYASILGGLLSAEQNIGYVHVRLKKHRWHKKILKTRDPLVISLGWRRFQSLVLYSIQDHNMRHRLLKYTPEHLHCEATFWGPITPQGTGILAVQSVAGSSPNFRISATGVVLELDKSKTVVKKLKLTGTPYKIYKKTAFIEGMFNSSLEVAKFEGSSIRTVSGIRGEIKKANSAKDGKEGSFRATFEDRIVLSDIVFVRTWYPVAIPQFYNPVTSMLLPAEEKNQWTGMKSAGQLKREKGIKAQVNEDHLYKTIERKPKVFKPLAIPKDLQKNLPFKDKPKFVKAFRDPVQSKRIAVVRDPKERKVATMMKMLKSLHEHKMKQRRNEMRNRAATHQKEKARIDAKREEKQKEIKKQIYRVIGKKEARKNKHQKD